MCDIYIYIVYNQDYKPNHIGGNMDTKLTHEAQQLLTNALNNTQRELDFVLSHILRTQKSRELFVYVCICTLLCQ